MIANEVPTPKGVELGGASVSPSGRLRITPNAISVCLFGPTGIPFRKSDLEYPSSPKNNGLPLDHRGEAKNTVENDNNDVASDKDNNESSGISADIQAYAQENLATAKSSENQNLHYHSDGAKDNVHTPLSSPGSLQDPDYVPARPVKLLNGSKKALFENTIPTENGKNSTLAAGFNQKIDTKVDGTKSPTTTKAHHVININELRRLASQGIPDSPFYPVSYSSSLRAIAWRVLLGYLPVETSQWAHVLKRDRALYRSLVKELFCSSDDIGSLLCSSNEKKSREKFHSWQVMSIENEDEPPTEIVSPSSNVIIRLSTSGGAQSLLGLDGLGGGDGVELLSVDISHSRTASSSELEGFSNVTQEVQNLYIHKDPSVDQWNGKLQSLPSQVKDQWKKSTRTLKSTDGTSDIEPKPADFLNALLIVDDEGHNHPLFDNMGDSSDRKNHSSNTKWTQFFENSRLLDEIRKDVDRTHPNLQFFLEPEDNIGQRRYAAIERILFVWAKLNRGVRYVQGMNEIVGTMYYVLANDPNDEWACEAEADTYFLFNTLMIDMKDIFVPDLDDAETGIQGRMTNMIDLLSLHDPEVQRHLDECGIGPAFYSIRWLTTLLSREFTLPDTIRLWDSMFASTFRDNFLRYVCVTMVIIIRESLLQGDFGTCLRLLQSYPPTNIDQLLEASRSLWIYESQVTLACHQGGISLNQALNAIVPPPTLIMAFGLHAGEKLDQLDVLKSKIQEDGKVVAKTIATNARTLLGSARDLLGFR